MSQNKILKSKFEIQNEKKEHRKKKKKEKQCCARLGLIHYGRLTSNFTAKPSTGRPAPTRWVHHPDTHSRSLSTKHHVAWARPSVAHSAPAHSLHCLVAPRCQRFLLHGSRQRWHVRAVKIAAKIGQAVPTEPEYKNRTTVAFPCIPSRRRS